MSPKREKMSRKMPPLGKDLILQWRGSEKLKCLANSCKIWLLNQAELNPPNGFLWNSVYFLSMHLECHLSV